MVALGMVAGIVPSIHWSPSTSGAEGGVRLPAASQYFVAAESRRAGTVLSSRTSEDEAPAVDGWLRRLLPGRHAGALRMILNHPAPYLRQRWVRVLFTSWAAAGRQEALQGALGIESPSLRLVALDAVMDDWSKRNARGAWEFVLSLTDPMIQSHVVGHLLDAQAGGDPQASVIWAGALQDPFLRSKAMEQIAKSWVRRDPRACLLWGQRVEDTMARRAIMGHAIARLSSQEPIRAFDAALNERDLVSRCELLTLAFQNASYARLPVALTWLRANQGKLDITFQPTMRVLGSTLANDRNQAKQLQQLARGLGSAPLADSLLAGAALRLIALGATLDAKGLLVGIGPGIEREEVKAALALP